MRVIIDRNKCVGSGNCIMTAPAVFDQADDDGIVILLDETPPESEHEAVRTAIEICPARVISWE